MNRRAAFVIGFWITFISTWILVKPIVYELMGSADPSDVMVGIFVAIGSVILLLMGISIMLVSVMPKDGS